jgi:hypothetical protein
MPLTKVNSTLVDGAINTDASGNVGIGTISPADKLEVNGIIRSNTLRTGATNRTLELYSGTAFNTGGAAVAIRGSATGYNDNGMEFYTSGSERMRIGSDGNLLVGTATSRGAATYGATILPVSSNAYNLGDASYRWSVIFLSNNPNVSSDNRLKTDIQDSDLGLEFVNSLRPVKYKIKVGQYISKKDSSGNVLYDENGEPIVEERAGVRNHYGFIAQEVKQALGEKDVAFWSLEDKNDPESLQALSYEQLISPLVKAIQEQQSIIKELKSRIETLEVK